MKHIITDWDGVLADTFDTNWQLVQELHPEVLEERYRIDHHLGNVFEHPVVPFTDATTAAYYKRYNELLSVAHIKAALPTIQRIGEHAVWHVVSSNCERAIQNTLREAGVEHLFGLILGQEAHASKVQKFLHLFNAKGFTADETVYLTDTLGDLTEAHNVGIRTIAVTFGYHPEAVLTRGNPTVLAHSWNEVEAAVHTLTHP